MNNQAKFRESQDALFDVLIIGGGVNGCGIARDAAGRGYSVCLAEMNDLASATSSASTKLFHGGLRYLEYFKFRLVREALIERETLLRAMPHISRPMRFVLPYSDDMRFEASTPTSRLLRTFMPWMHGRRPAWLIRFGLLIYDHLAKRNFLPGTNTVNLVVDPVGRPLKQKFKRAFEYSDCWVDDARLVALNARDAGERGAQILTRTMLKSATVEGSHWRVHMTNGEATWTVCARMLVNATGPWVGDIMRGALRMDTNEGVRLVRGSHIVTKRLFDHEKSYFFQGEDGRIIFAIPYEDDFTLIGTTDIEHSDASVRPVCTEEEVNYLCAFVSKYLDREVVPSQVVWKYSGVRPLYDGGSTSATAATRDYTLKIDKSLGLPLLNVYGGKITTYRRLAESAVEKIETALDLKGTPWTAGVPLPGGDFPVSDVSRLVEKLRRAYPYLSEAWARRLIRAYGTEASQLLANSRSASDLGASFAATLTEREVRWLMQREFAKSATDILWRRTKLGLQCTSADVEQLEAWMVNEEHAVHAAQ